MGKYIYLNKIIFIILILTIAIVSFQNYQKPNKFKQTIRNIKVEQSVKPIGTKTKSYPLQKTTNGSGLKRTNHNPVNVKAAISHGKYLKVIYRQNSHASIQAYDKGQLIKTITAWGPKAGLRKIKGTFTITNHKQVLHASKYGLFDLPFWMGIQENYGFHGVKLNKSTGVYEPGSTMGCIATNLQDATWLFDWAPNGTVVILN
jgi:hypothetical protein